MRALDGPDVTASDLVIGSAIGGLPVRPRAYTASGLTALLETYARAPRQFEALEVRIDLRRQADHVAVTTIDAELLPAEQEGAGVSRRANS